ncbi:MAG TPA: hypothetical protein VH157_03195 [Bryobacteraceae bacterium]|nr:hypothetical protein [Bryobacteraceae bacterium]
MRPVFFIVLIAATASAQYAIDPARGAKFFAAHADDRSMHCEVIPVPARLSFSFRFQTGYVVRMPLKQYAGPGHHWNILVRVVPEGGAAPFYLGSYTRLRNAPKTNAQGEFGGAYQVGEGRYAVDWMLADDMNRTCRKSWKVEAKLDHRERGLKLGMTAGTVGPITFRRWSPKSEEGDDRAISRLTVLLHAAPLYPRSTRFRMQDRLLLVGSLAALLEALPARSVRVVVFNLDQQKELFRQDDLTPDSFDQVAQSTSNLQLQVVDYRVLQNRRGHVGLLSDMINQELAAAQPSDKVIFLGPTSRFYDKIPETAFAQPSAPAPQFFYFEYKPYWGREADFPDSVAMAIRKVKGKTMLIHTPDEFARAIRDVETPAGSRN